MMGVGYSEMLLILVVALIVLGPDRLPEVGRLLGKTLRAFRGVQDEFSLRLRESARPPVVDLPVTPAAAAKKDTADSSCTEKSV